MRKALSLALLAVLPIVSTTSVFAQDFDDVTETGTMTTENNSTSVENATLNAPSNTTVVTSNSMTLGEDKEISCSSDVIFGQNSCDQCFDGGSVTVGEKKTGLFDNWKNGTDNMLVAVKDEQKTPNMVSYGSNWISSNADESKMWKYNPSVVWMADSTSNKEEFLLTPGNNVRFTETDLGAGYTLESTTKNNGDVVGLLRYPIVYRVQSTDGTKSDAKEHYECVAYKLSVPTTPTTPTTPPVTPKTEVETGPAETLVLIIAAFFVAFGLMLSLRKRA